MANMHNTNDKNEQ